MQTPAVWYCRDIFRIVGTYLVEEAFHSDLSRSLAAAKFSIARELNKYIMNMVNEIK